MLRREVATVYSSVMLVLGAHAVKTHAYIRGNDAFLVRRFIRGIDGLDVANHPERYPDSFISNERLASLYVAYRVIMGDADYNNSRNIVLAHNSGVVGEMAGATPGPTVVMIDGEANFPSDELFSKRIVPTMGVPWTPGMPYEGSVEWRHALVSKIGRSEFISKSVALQDPLLNLLAHRLTPSGVQRLELSRPAMIKMVNGLEDTLRYLGNFQVYSKAELNDPKLPIRYAMQCLHDALVVEKPVTLGDAIAGFFSGSE